jgi:mono/diheme cytochrome c family protein
MSVDGALPPTIRVLRPRVLAAPWLVVAFLTTAACGGGSEAAGTASGRGAELYATNCASCHGEDLRGTTAGPSLLSVVYEPGHHPDESFRRAVSQGVPGHHWAFGDMPPVPAMPTADIDSIVAFVRAQQLAEGFEPYPPR